MCNLPRQVLLRESIHCDLLLKRVHAYIVCTAMPGISILSCDVARKLVTCNAHCHSHSPFWLYT